ncbi:DUF4190 domain-containing protein [Streptomyces sp. SCSIO 30461]|uniref:DUF4190 domain-containing protein n=1 Tax=Streptomyces sp. SCSIO 30461 TaxID=3118085 RepID=UPI0030D1BC48
MTTPPPTDAQHAAGQPSARHDPWGPRPSTPTVVPGVPYSALPPQPQPHNSMGITALVLGTVGAVLGMVVILFWMAWLPALLAVIFGFIGLGHARKGRATNRGMALAGVILGVTGLLFSVGGGVFTVVSVMRASDSAHARAEASEAAARAEAEASEAAAEKAAEEEAAKERARHLSFGESYTFENGLKVTVAKPKPFVPHEIVFGHAKGNKAIQVTVTVVNTGKQRLSVQSGLPNVSDADGASAELVIDGSGRQKVITGHVLPGAQAVGKYAFSLPPDAADRVEVEFSPDLALWEGAYWSGPN